MNAFPLAPFLYSLIADGVPVSLDDYSRISLVLSTGDKWTRARLRGVLIALLASNSDHAERIGRRFDSFFIEPDNEEFSKEEIDLFIGLLREAVTKIDQIDAGPVSRTDTKPAQPTPPVVFVTKRKIRQRLIISGVATAVILAGVLVAYLTRPASQEVAQNGGTGDGSTSTSAQRTETATGDGTSGLVTDDPRPIRQRPRSKERRVTGIWIDIVNPAQMTATPHRWTDLLATLAAVCAIVLLWLGLRLLVAKAIRDPPLEFNANSPRHFPFSLLGESARPQINGSTLDELADSINYFLSTRPSKRLDIVATIEATGDNGGMPDLRFHRQKQVRRVCIFEDARSKSLKWNRTTSELFDGLEKRGIEVLFGTFLGSLNQFVLRDGHTYWLDDLDNERRDSLFLFFSDGKYINTHQDFFALERLAKLPLVAWFDFREPRFWDESAYLISLYGIPLYQANAEGLMRAFDRFLLESTGEVDDAQAIRHWRGFPPFTDGQLAAYIEHLLGDALVWAQVCAMIQPLSLNLAHTLRRAFQPHLPFERIERLFKLPGTTWQGSCLHFSRPVVAALRGGFVTRLSPAQQESMLDLIKQQIRRLEPPKREKSLRRLAWEWTLRRVELESAPDEVLPILSQLAQTPLGAEIKADLSHLVFVDQSLPSQMGDDWVSVPLRTRPLTTKGISYLKQLSPHVVVTSNLQEKFVLNWRRFRFILTRVSRYLRSELALYWNKTLRYLNLKTEEASEPGARGERYREAMLVAEPAELVLRRLFVGDVEARTITFRTTSGLGLAGRLESDNEWLAINPSSCDEKNDHKTVDVVINTSHLTPGKHAGNIRFIPADGSEFFEVPVSLELYRSWGEAIRDWWDKNRPKHPKRATALLVLFLAAIVFLNYRVLPGNWPNRIYNRPPVLTRLNIEPNGNLPVNMIELQTIAEDADGDVIHYEWTTDWGTITNWNPPVLEAPIFDSATKVNLRLTLKDSRGGVSHYSSVIELEAGSRSYYDEDYYDYEYFAQRSAIENRYLRERWEARNEGLDWAFVSQFDYPDVETLLNDLRVGGSRERWIAANSLRHVTVEREQVIPVLVESLNVSDLNVLKAVVSTLSRFGYLKTARAALPRIINLFKSDQPQDIRLTAARALAGFTQDHQRTVPVLMQALEDEDEAVASAAAAALGTIGPDAKAGLIDQLSKTSDVSNVRTKYFAARALAGPNMEAESDVVSALIAVLNTQGSDVELRRTAAYTLAQLGPGPEIANYITPHVKDHSAQVRSAAVSVLWSISAQTKAEPSVVSALLEASRDENPEVRRTAIRALGDIQPEPENLQMRLLQGLDDVDAEVRHAAVRVLEGRETSFFSQLIAILKDSNKERSGAAEALGVIALSDDETTVAIDTLATVLTNSDMELRRTAAYSLVRLAGKSQKAVPALLDYLNSSDHHLKNAAISAIWAAKGNRITTDFGPMESTITIGVLQALTDEWPLIREHAVAVLANQSTNDSVTTALRNVATSDENVDVASAALHTLSDSKVLCANLPEFLKSRLPSVRLRILQLVYPSYNEKCSNRLTDPDVIEQLIKLADDSDSSIRFSSISVLYQLPLGRDHATELLSKLWDDRNARVRLTVLSIMSPEDPRTLPLIKSALSDPDPRLRRSAIIKLSDTESQDALSEVEHMLNDRDRRVRDTATVLRYLLKMRLGAGEPSASEKQLLKDIAENGDTTSSRFVLYVMSRSRYGLLDKYILDE
jgi:HEAT repeat protein